MRRLALLPLVFAIAGGCSARFIDEHPGGAGVAVSLPAAFDLGAPLETLHGEFIGRAGHVGFGGADVIRYDSGYVEVRFLPTFYVSDVPGPIIVLASRDSLGTALDLFAGDLEVDTLRGPTGAQSYFFSGELDGRRNLFVFCEPFGLEVALAPLQ